MSIKLRQLQSYTDCVPDITVNSSGQSFIAWQHSEALYYWGFKIAALNSVNTAVKPFNIDNGWSIGPAVQKVFGTLSPDTYRDPSITGFPRTLVPQSGIPTSDRDPGAVELLFWDYSPSLLTNVLKDEGYYETMPGHTGQSGYWMPSGSLTSFPYIQGTNSQRSFGTYNSGIAYGTLFNDRGSYATGNSVTSPLQFVSNPFPEIDANLKGTYATPLDVNLYRTEIRIKDSTEAIHFTWGGVQVGDTSTSLPMRQVMLHTGFDTSGYYPTAQEARDSLFGTELFDWPVGAQIKYWRGFLVPDSTAYVVDTCIASPDTLGRSLMDPGFAMMYTVELVHADDGSIDTLEQIKLDPYHGYSPMPGLMTVTNGNLSSRDVYLRVVASELLGVHIEDSLVTFRDESIYDGGYPVDTTYSLLAYKTARPGFAAIVGHLAVSSLFPNPLVSGSNVHAFIAYPANHILDVSIADQLGRDIIDRHQYQSTGDWQPINLTVPNGSGAYFLTVRCGSESKTIPLTVTR